MWPLWRFSNEIHLGPPLIRLQFEKISRNVTGYLKRRQTTLWILGFAKQKYNCDQIMLIGLTYRAVYSSLFGPKTSKFFSYRFAMFISSFRHIPGNLRCRYRLRFKTANFWQKNFPGHLPQRLSWSSQAVKTQGAVMEDGHSRQVWRLSLKVAKGPTWGTGIHVKLQLKGALSLCTEVLSSSADFHTDFHSACPWVVLLRIQPESRESAGLDPADISLWAESQPTNSHRKVQRCFTVSGMTLASKLELQADKKLPNTPTTATLYQQQPSVSEKDNRKQINWMFKCFPLPPTQDCNALLCGDRMKCQRSLLLLKGKQEWFVSSRNRKSCWHWKGFWQTV